MKKISAVLFVLLVLCSLIQAQNNDYKKFVGAWIGTYEGNNEIYTARIVFTDVNGKLTGTVESSENASAGQMAVDDIVINGSSIKFTVMSSIKYEGTYKEEKNRIEGNLTGMNGAVISLDMIKEKSPAKENNFNHFIGSWKATLDDGGNEKIFILVLSENNGKLEGTLEIANNNSGSFQLDKIKTEGNNISFEIMGALYEGTYKQDKKTIEGTGTEGENPPVAVNFVKEK